MQQTPQSTGNNEYEARVGIEWDGASPLEVQSHAEFGVYTPSTPYPLHQYVGVDISVDASAAEIEYERAVYDLALNCVNQGGGPDLHAIHLPDD